MRKCKYLTNAIYVDIDNIRQYIDEQNEKFRRDFVDNLTYFNGLPIIVTHENDKTNYGQTLNDEIYKGTAFAHIVSKQIDKRKKDRELDIQRLKTCHWVKEIIEYFKKSSSQCTRCQKFYFKHELDGGEDLTYMFCANVRYVVILQKITSQTRQYYIIKTAYYVDNEGVYRGFMRKLAS